MALSEKDIDRIGDKIALRISEKLDDHKEKDHKPLERRVGKLQNDARILHGLQASALAVIGFFKGH